MIRNILLVGLGGAIGTIARYVISSSVTRWLPHSFPFGTFVVNIAGCFIIGLVYGLAGRSGWLNTEWRLFLATGICGGFTTFSAFAYESFTIIETSAYFTFAAYSILSVVICIVAVFLGIGLARL